MGLFSRNKEVEEQRSQDGAGVLPPHRSEVLYNQDSVLSLGAVFRCVQVISTTLAQLPMLVYRGTDEIVSPLARQPDMNEATNDFWGSTAVSLALHGNAYWWVSRNSDGEVKNLQVLNPREVVITRDDRMGAPYRYDYNGRRIQNKNISHIKLMSLPDKLYGVGPIQSARRDIEYALQLREWGNSFLTNGGIPTGVLSSDQYLNQEQSDAYRTAWNEAQESRGLAVLGAGMTYSPIALSPEDIAYLENQKYTTNQIARLFGVPPVFIGSGLEGGSLTYSTAETQSILFLQTTMSDYLVSIEEAFSALLPRGQVGKFRLDSLLRADLASRTEANAKLIQNKVITPEEVRLLEGWSKEPVGTFFEEAVVSTPTNRQEDK